MRAEAEHKGENGALGIGARRGRDAGDVRDEAVGATMRDPREVIREETLMHRPILDAVAAGPLSVPQIAEAVGRPAHEVLYWVMGMRRYRKIVELPEPDDDGYFLYAEAGKEQA